MNVKRMNVKLIINDPDTGRRYIKKRYRCPKCMRGLLGADGFCPVHLFPEKPVDLLSATEKQIRKALFYEKVEK